MHRICARGRNMAETNKINILEQIYEKVESYKYLRVMVNEKSMGWIEIFEQMQAEKWEYWKYHRCMRNQTEDRQAENMLIGILTDEAACDWEYHMLQKPCVLWSVTRTRWEGLRGG